MEVKVLITVYYVICSLLTAKAQEQYQSGSLIQVNLEYNATDKHIHLTIVNKEKVTVYINSSHSNGSNVFIDFLTLNEANNICPANEVGLGTPYQQRVLELPPKEKYEYTYKLDDYSSYKIKSSLNRIRFMYNIKYYTINGGNYELKSFKGNKLFYL